MLLKYRYMNYCYWATSLRLRFFGHGLHGFSQIKKITEKSVEIRVIRGYILLILKFLIMNNLLFEKKTYTIIGLCMEVHKILGHGFSEIVYKDALMLEAKFKNICAEREKEFKIEYKQTILQHSFFADFVFFNDIIVEVKASEDAINNATISQTLNYLKASGCRVGLIINFGAKSLKHQRLIF